MATPLPTPSVWQRRRRWLLTAQRQQRESSGDPCPLTGPRTRHRRAPQQKEEDGGEHDAARTEPGHREMILRQVAEHAAGAGAPIVLDVVTAEKDAASSARAA